MEEKREIYREAGDWGEGWEEWKERNFQALRCRPRSQKRAYIEVMEKGERGEEIKGSWEEEESEKESIGKGDPIVPFFQREVYFGKLSPSAKVRPFLILQNNLLNRLCWEEGYSTILVAPLSGRLAGGEYRIFIPQRDNLTRPSEVVLTAIGVISPAKLLWSRGRATILTEEEWGQVVEGVKKILGVEKW
ncbi:MAG: hypothetical protein C6I01_06330 [Epsilonproteobacteria bacterium]|jgi:mRNA interferase MazF|nr:hypothetical protein [Campylobacterota bacterium]NPA88644.1 type II toxin-antitoxin system PemK/MazF family toxin [Campylobacterota bacterium]